ncbi:MAG: hypothetical protein ACFFD4_03800 [Candidatus Odinarchaeota archaeon]
MAVEYGMSLVDELKEILKRRRNIAEQFEMYKRTYSVLIKELQETFQIDEDSVCAALFLNTFVMSGIEGQQKRMSDIARTQLILENLIKAREYMPIDLGGLIAVYQLVHEQAVRIEKDMVEKVRLLVKKPVILSNLVDVYAVSLLSFLEQVNPSMDLRWAMAELEGGLNNRFASSCYDNIKADYPLSKMDSRVYFDAGAYIIKKYMNNYLWEKYDKKELEQYGDIGTKEHEYASSLFYDKKSREFYLEPSLSDKLELSEQLSNHFKTSLHINHPMFRKDNPYRLVFAKFYVQIITNGKRVERHFFIHNYEETDTAEAGLGTWNFLVLSSENINLQSLISYAKRRCFDIRGIKARITAKEPPEPADYIPSAWDETYIHNLQEEYQFLSEKDLKREQGFIPVALLRQEHESKEIELLIESKEGLSDRTLRDTLVSPSFESLTLITPEEVEKLLGHVRTFNAYSYETLRLFLIQQNEDVEITFYPNEFLYQQEKEPTSDSNDDPIDKDILLLFSTDESRLVGILSQNEESLSWKGTKALKLRPIRSKINQLLTDLRVKSLQDAREAKLEEFITHGKHDLIESAKLWLTGTVQEAYEKIEAKEVVDDRVRAAKKEEIERLQTLRQNYFHDVVIKHFYNSVSLDLQKKILEFLKKDFSATTLEKEYSIVERQVEHLKGKSAKELGMSEESIDLINRLREKIIDDIDTSLYKVEVELMKLRQLVEKMSEDEILDLF